MTTDAGDPEYFWLSSRARLAQGEEIHNGVRVQRFAIRHLPYSHVVYPHTRQLVAWLSRLPMNTSRLLALLSFTTPYVPSLHRRLDSTAEKYHLVHAANVLFEPLVAAAQRYARTHSLPFLLTPFVHLGEPENPAVRINYTNRHQIEMIRASDKIITQTDIESRFLAGLGVPLKKMAKVGVGVNPEAIFGGNGVRFRHKHDVSEPLVFFIGAQSFDKGVRDLVEAMKLLWSGGCQARLALAGTRTKHFAAYFDVQPEWVRGRCLQLGLVSDEEKRDLLAAGDVFAMPSRTDSFGIVYLEAWLYKKPVIGALAGGVPEVIGDGTDGLLVDFGDVKRLASCISSLLENSQHARDLGEAGYQKVLREHTWDKKFAMIDDIYRELCR